MQAGRDHDRYSMFLDLRPLYRLFAGFYLGYALPRGNDVECHSHSLLPLVYCCLPIHPHACLTLMSLTESIKFGFGERTD